ncbi:MAG TPA: carbon monoxide dehydrogenase subunit G [Woeseiaceae bacterium]|jgi:carbon monoxide dehydrogenase subunit G|nr:carbon monoxide dehydrogenase subunit G [Woeseiaceae bacterium]
MEIKGEYRIARSRRQVWDALNDPAMLQKCIPGCESMERQAENEYRARVAAAIGPVRAKFDTRILLENLNPPESYTLTGESKAGAAGFGRGSANVRLAEDGDGTRLSYSADFRVGGRLAQVGSRLVLGATRKTADDFFGSFARELDEQAVQVTPPAEGRPRRAARIWLAATLVGAAALLIAWFLLR